MKHEVKSSAQLHVVVVIAVFLDFYPFSGIYVREWRSTGRAPNSRSTLRNHGNVAAGATVLLIGCMAPLRKHPIGWLFLYPRTSWYSHQLLGSIYTLGTTSAKSKVLTEENYKRNTLFFHLVVYFNILIWKQNEPCIIFTQRTHIIH